MALDLASDLGDNRAIPDPGLLSASFGTQLELAALRRHRTAFLRSTDDEDGNGADIDNAQIFSRVRNTDTTTRRMNRLMLARMTTLEEGFRDILKEVKGLNLSRGSRSIGDGSDIGAPGPSRSREGSGQDDGLQKSGA